MKSDAAEYVCDLEMIAEAYYNLFDVESWLFKYEEVLQNFESTKNDVSAAETLSTIGAGFLELSDLLRAKDYFLRASVLYNALGHRCRLNFQLEGAQRYYESAIDCIRKASNG